MHTPSVGAVSGGLYQQYPRKVPSNPNMSNMEPPQMSQIPGYLSKFVAGPARLEANPLGEPIRTIRPLSPNSNASGPQSIGPLKDYDLQNPDVQYERYKHLM